MLMVYSEVRKLLIWKPCDPDRLSREQKKLNVNYRHFTYEQIGI